jgi:hypothetical protein
MRALQRMRQAINEQRYRISAHANEEMSNDRLMVADVERVVCTGQITHRFTRDPRGIRYEVSGQTISGRHACVVCRFLSSGVLLVITAYVPGA